MSTFGGGTFGSELYTFDGLLISPVDITIVDVDYTPSLSLEASRESFSASVTYVPSVTISGTHAPAIAASVAHNPSVSLSASHTPSIEKGGTP